MPLIDASYFQGKIKIAQLSSPAVAENLKWFIDHYETEALKKILGLDLFKRFKAGIAAETVLPEWEALKIGKVYETTEGKKREWEGFVNDAKKSLLANYVYFFYMENEASQTVGIGAVTPLAENANRVSSGPKMARAWNEMLDKLDELVYFLKSDPFYEFSVKKTKLCEFNTVNTFGI